MRILPCFIKFLRKHLKFRFILYCLWTFISICSCIFFINFQINFFFVFLCRMLYFQSFIPYLFSMWLRYCSFSGSFMLINLYFLRLSLFFNYFFCFLFLLFCRFLFCFSCLILFCLLFWCFVLDFSISFSLIGLCGCAFIIVLRILGFRFHLC